MRKQLLLLTLLGTIGILLIQPLSAQSPVGVWKTIDDETGKPKSLVQIYEENGKYYGKITKLFREPNEDQDPYCDECDPKDPRYKKRVIGMVILTGLKKESSTKWGDGEILDPKNGEVYDCYIELVEPNKLKVRGFIGTWLTGSSLGRTQYWHREP
ncbi:MAG: DUF2147 domain-containing protein [Bacteroidia bacterium]